MSTAFYCQQTGAAVLAKDKMWPKHSQLVVVFLDGTPQQKKLVKKIAPLWLENSSLSFHFYNDFKSAPTETHIRVSFKGTTGSVLGNHGDFSSQQPTLQLAKLNEEDLPENFAKRWILHEFGHALGFEHEFRNPDWPYGNAPIEQQISACYPGMIKLDYSEQQARTKCREINQVLSKYSTNSTIYDEYSIMNYPMEIAQGKNISKKIHARFELSVLDKLAIERWYGK
ncbi:hypothetical protein FLL45_11950 [Aliikangiella marina]|uniref:Peptidase metallopeptidase domain-containing protein n=1 Tax=Aliikangiella marina TaxID=1712262 RepID=A0A545T8M9_9GAMM|nr:hypothetical protein [Aliikangiella marina]TQV73580.1 hypothetical protein FLL45_11950 [Aliikangiella marina]